MRKYFATVAFINIIIDEGILFMQYNFSDIKIGIGLTGSFCTFKEIFDALENLKSMGADIITVFSDKAKSTDTRFGVHDDFLKKAASLSSHPIITTIPDAEPIGPKNLVDIMFIAPCTGNTLAKLANGISDSPVLMAAKSTLRNNKPVVIFLSSNDALGLNLKNIGTLLSTKNIFFVPFGQDNPEAKPNSMISHFELIPDTLFEALKKSQLQPVVISPHQKS